MVITGGTFVLGVLTCYTCYRYLYDQSELFKHLTVIHIIWMTFFGVLTFGIIYFGSSLSREV